jgi:hypothetical protein
VLVVGIVSTGVAMGHLPIDVPPPAPHQCSSRADFGDETTNSIVFQ